MEPPWARLLPREGPINALGLQRFYNRCVVHFVLRPQAALSGGRRGDGAGRRLGRGSVSPLRRSECGLRCMQTGSHGGSLRVLHPTLETNASRSDEGSGFIDLGRGLCRVIVGDARFAVPAHCELSGFRCCVPCTTTSLAPTCGQMTPGCSGLECLKICKADSSCTGVQVRTDLATDGCYTYVYAVRLVLGLGSQRCVLMGARLAAITTHPHSPVGTGLGDSTATQTLPVLSATQFP